MCKNKLNMIYPVGKSVKFCFYFKMSQPHLFIVII